MNSTLLPQSLQPAHRARAYALGPALVEQTAFIKDDTEKL